MSANQKLAGLIFLTAVLALTLYVLNRVYAPTGEKGGGVAKLLSRKSDAVARAQPKPSAAVPVPSTAPSSNTQTQGRDGDAGALATGGGGPGNATTSSSSAPPAQTPGNAAPVPSVGNAAPAPAVHLAQLRFEAGVRLWIRITAISRKPDGSFTFRGTLLQPVELANRNQLDQGTELAGSGTVNNGHVMVLVKDFTVGGANYALQQNDASGSNKRPGAGLAVELDPGKLLEVWLAASSVYRKTP
jgi:hypothetical protein